MSRSDMMREKRESKSVDLIKLIKKIESFDDSVICVFEGDDVKYYGSRIDSILGHLERKNLSCKGKKNVLDLKESVDKNIELHRANIIFFVDTDFDEKMQDYNLYSTPCHSIENFYASKSVFKKILIDELGLCSFSDVDLIKELVDKYIEFEELSDDSLLELNAWIMTRLDEYKTNQNIKLNLNNISLKSFLEIDNFSVEKKYKVEDLDRFFSIETPLNRELFKFFFDKIDGSNKKNVCRGKYRLECFREILNDLLDMLRNGSGLFYNRKIKPRMTLVKTNLISELSQYAETPSCLIDFLNTYKQSRNL